MVTDDDWRDVGDPQPSAFTIVCEEMRILNACEREPNYPTVDSLEDELRLYHLTGRWGFEISRLAISQLLKKLEPKEKRRVKPVDSAKLSGLDGLSYSHRNVIIQSLGFDDYRGYRSSALWSGIRQKVFSAYGLNCVLCSQPATEIHHRRYNYETMLGVSLKWLAPLCGSCHDDLHWETRTRRCYGSFAEFGVRRTLAMVDERFVELIGGNQ